jgi:ATP-dependent DNA helicase DinG
MNVEQVFAPEGLLAKYFKEYEQRPEQVRMAKLVETAIGSGFPAVIEGEPGVGKSFAYLVPIILSKKKAIISTSHKSLQDQLSKKDLPVLKEVLPVDFNWAVLKGKNNYFCAESFQAYQKDLLKIISKEEVKRITDWVKETEDGDVEYFPGELQPQVRELITCDTNTIHQRDSVFYDLCFAVRARLEAQKAQIILVNHTLVALDIALRRKTDNKIKLLPKVDVIVIDEAHTFEKYATMAFSDKINIFSLVHLLNWSVVKNSVPQRERNELLEAFSLSLKEYLPEKRDSYYQQEKHAKFSGCRALAKKIGIILEKVKANPKLQFDDAGKKKTDEVVKEGENLVERLVALSEEDENMLRWSEAKELRDGRVIITLKSVPLDISELLRSYLFKDQVIICTSATLAINRDFSFFKQQLGVPVTALELAVGSPFDFRKNSLIYISNGEQEKRWEIEQLVKYSKGNAFVLFTSYKDMWSFFESVNVPYPKLVQSEGISRAELLKQFKKTPHAVLFATKSFWEGIDVKGNALILVVIHKLPFENPADLVYTSKIERIEERLGKGKHWTRYTIPDACLKLKQGVGRLIRSKTDIGVIALLDARVNYQSYGKAFLSALPQAAYRTQKLEKVKRFYKEKGI